MPIALSRRDPDLRPDEVVAALRPPPTFADVSFESYHPDRAEPSQSAALASVRAFVERQAVSPGRQRWLRRSRREQGRHGLYLDGGFGVGKTHLLAAIWQRADGPKLFATFVELTHLVGALGFADAVDRLSGSRMLCIDEFELDDPGDTVLISTLLGRLVERGVWVAATSNTLPGALGAGRFASEDFVREIQALAAHFDVVRIDGPDYRHRQFHGSRPPVDVERLREMAAAYPGAAYDHFVDLSRHLEQVHPSRYGALVDGVELVCLEDVRTLSDQNTALRLVVLVDRLYDRGIGVVSSGSAMADVFSAEMLQGAYRKKYQRALSRLSVLTAAPQPR